MASLGAGFLFGIGLFFSLTSALAAVLLHLLPRGNVEGGGCCLRSRSPRLRRGVEKGLGISPSALPGWG